jgi:hypothetical protein
MISHVSELVNSKLFHAMKAVQDAATNRWSVHVQVKPKARFQPLAGTDVRSKRAAVGIIQAFTVALPEVVEESKPAKAKKKTTAKRVQAKADTPTKPKAGKRTKAPKGSGTGVDPVSALRNQVAQMTQQLDLLLATPNDS